MSRNRRRKPKKSRNQRPMIHSRPQYYNICKAKPKKFFADLYVKNVINLALSEKSLKPFLLSEEYMNEFTPLLENITSFKKKKTFKEMFEILDTDPLLAKKDKKIIKNLKKIRKNLTEEIIPESIGEIFEFIKQKMADREIESPYHISHYLLQSCAILSRLGRTKHQRELTCTNSTVEIFSDLLGNNIGYGERLLLLYVLSFLASDAYMIGVQELSRRYQRKKQREKYLKEKKEAERKKKREAKEKKELEKAKANKNKGKKGSDEEEEESEEEEEEEESEEEEEDSDEDEDDLEDDEYMKKLQSRAHIKDDELFDSLINMRDTLTSLDFFQKLSNNLYLPTTRVCISCSQLSLKIVYKLLFAAYEDRDHFEKVSFNVVLGKDVDFADHFYQILNEHTDQEEEEEEDGEEEKGKKDGDNENSEPPKVTMKFNKDSDILSYTLSCLFYIAFNPSKKVHRRLSSVYEKLIEIIQTQSDIYVKSKPKNVSEAGGGGRKKVDVKHERVKLDWSLITSVCCVISNLGGQNPHLARHFADYLIEDLIHLLEYAHYSNLENMECYSALTVLLGTVKSMEMKQYVEDFPLMKFVARDLRTEKKVEMIYPSLLCFKTILGVFASNTNTNFDDNYYAMKIVSRHLKAVERVFRFGIRIFDYRVPPEQTAGAAGGKKKNRKKMRKKQKKNLSEEEMKRRDKEMKFAWPCLVTTIHMISNCRRKLYSRSPSEVRGLEGGLESFDRMLQQFDRINLLLKISDDVSKLKKKDFSYKKVLILFVVIVCIIVVLPVSYSILGFGGKKEIPGEGNNDGGGGE